MDTIPKWRAAALLLAVSVASAADAERPGRARKLLVGGCGLGYVAGVRRLPNGNTLICNWGGHGGAKGPALFEITRQKELVWRTPQSIKNRVSAVDPFWEE